MNIEEVLLLSFTDKSIWKSIEWFCATTGILGTIWAAAYRGSYLYISWILWLIAGFGFILMHIMYTHQYGLLTLSGVSFLVTFYGLINYLNHNKKIILEQPQKNSFMILLCYLFLFLSFCCILFLITGNNSNWQQSSFFEWSAIFINLSGLTAISSNSKISKYCWFFWGISNGMLAVLTFYTGQMGLFSQQIFFSFLNVWGIVGWFFLKKKIIEKDLEIKKA